eukprot:1189260-Prorocentrum_minimum.AAC.3
MTDGDSQRRLTVSKTKSSPQQLPLASIPPNICDWGPEGVEWVGRGDMWAIRSPARKSDEGLEGVGRGDMRCVVPCKEGLEGVIPRGIQQSVLHPS